VVGIAIRQPGATPIGGTGAAGGPMAARLVVRNQIPSLHVDLAVAPYYGAVLRQLRGLADRKPIRNEGGPGSCVATSMKHGVVDKNPA